MHAAIVFGAGNGGGGAKTWSNSSSGEVSDWNGLTAQLRTQAVTMAEIRANLDKPVLDNQLDYSKSYCLSPSYLAAANWAAWSFGANSQLLLHAKRPHAALGEVLYSLKILRWLEGDRSLVSQWKRTAICTGLFGYTWEALQAEGWTEVDLATLQEAWEKTHFLTPLLLGLQEEQACMLQAYVDAHNPESEFWRFLLYDANNEKSPALRAEFNTVEKFLLRIMGFCYFDQKAANALCSMHFCLQKVRSAQTNCSFSALGPELDKYVTNRMPSGFFACLKNGDFLGSSRRVCNAFKNGMRAETQRSIVITAIALKRYSLRHDGKAPASLEALVPDYLASIPTDYMDGGPVKYSLNRDGSFTLYSVGEDGIDELGDASPVSTDPKKQDLWDRKDFVWPALASEQTAAK